MAEIQLERESTAYWCHSCEKRVTVETHVDLSDLVCFECKGGFVESVSSATVLDLDDIRPDFHQIDESDFGSHLIRVLRLVAQAAREEDAPPPPSGSSVEDFLRVELGRRVIHVEEDDDDNEDERSVEVLGNGDDRSREDDIEGRDRQESDDEAEESTLVGEDDEEEITRRRLDVQLQFRDFASRAASLLEWGEILLGRDGHRSGAYVGNPGDYVDAAGYETLLQNLAEIDGEGRRGPPPAAKAAVEGLENLVVKKEEEVVLECAICKDLVKVGEIAKKLPCGHGYHGECIFPWLKSRNSCPVCRFEMPTDDLEYEKDRKQRMETEGSRAASSNSSDGCGGSGSELD